MAPRAVMKNVRGLILIAIISAIFLETVEGNERRSETYYVKEDGYIQSPNYPSPYPHNFDGVWHVTFPEQYRVKIVFDEIYLEAGREDCRLDYILLYDETPVGRILLGKYCSNYTAPFQIWSSTNQVDIEFHTDRSVAYRGFKARVTPVLSEEYYVKENGIISSPNYSNSYPNDFNGTWYFTFPEGYRIRIVFDKEFHLEDRENCLNNFIALYDGPTFDDRLLGIYCSNQAPLSEIRSSKNQMVMRFLTNHLRSYTGFKATIKAEICPGTIVSDTVKETLFHYFLETKRDQTRAINKWGTNLARAAVVMSLTGKYYTDDHGYLDEMLYELTLQFKSKLVTKKFIPTRELALYINAMKATCINPKNFYGLNIVAELRKRVDNSNQTNPFFLLSLCIGGDNMTSEDVEKLQQQFNEQSRPSWTESQAMIIMALKCISHKLDINLNDSLEDMASNITKKQQNNGSVENVKTTALVLQALIATGSYQSNFNISMALSHILKRMKRDDTEELHYVLPVLYSKSLLDIESFKCENFTKTELKDVEKLMNELIDNHVKIQVSVIFGEDVDFSRTWRIKVPSNYSLYQVIENNISASDTTDTNYKVSYIVLDGKPYIAALGNFQNSIQDDLFWFTYTKPLSSNSDLVLVEQSPVDVKIKDDAEIVLWYRSGPLPNTK